MHRFIGAYVRYEIHVFAFISLIANPFPGFTGTPGTYPVDVEIAPRERQNRWKTLFRLFLMIPAQLLASALWRRPRSSLPSSAGSSASSSGGCPRACATSARTACATPAQAYGYSYLLTDSYPYTGPTEYVAPEPEDAREELPPWPGPLRLPSPSS